ncbi:transposase [Methylomarinovum caldicuralii]|uniref:Transposase n=1 Tax=Methylomarinovum caldicuralii TaxID=438856 RepID=A0AAU9C186_9GAMM|nr:phage integrase N-terminal SAM-like domain-containing protein [Methylomarinovum caldicuralii]BCX80844.1 transposase [Methylomarinovum caldicuralii]
MTDKPKLLNQVRMKIRQRHYSIRTEQAWVDWIRRFIVFHGKRHPTEMGSAEVEAFLTHLAVDRNAAAATQNQAFSALLFLYREVLGKGFCDVLSSEHHCLPLSDYHAHDFGFG